MAAAAAEVEKQQLTPRESLRLYNDTLETLGRRMNGMVPMDCWPRTVLSEEEETKLVDYLRQMSGIGYGLPHEGILGLAYRSLRKANDHILSRIVALEDLGLKGSWGDIPCSQESLSYCQGSSAIKETISDFFGKLGSLYGELNLLSNQCKFQLWWYWCHNCFQAKQSCHRVKAGIH